MYLHANPEGWSVAPEALECSPGWNLLLQKSIAVKSEHFGNIFST